MAVNRRDATALAGLCTKDVEFRPILATLTEESYRGHEGLRRWLAEVDRRFPGSAASAEEIDDRGDALLVSGATRGPGVAFSWHLAVRLADGLIAAWGFHPSRAHARRAIEDPPG